MNTYLKKNTNGIHYFNGSHDFAKLHHNNNRSTEIRKIQQQQAVIEMIDLVVGRMNLIDSKICPGKIGTSTENFDIMVKIKI